jgi:hypothetical protein
VTAALVALAFVSAVQLAAILYLVRSVIAASRYENTRLLNAVLAKSPHEFSVLERVVAASPRNGAAPVAPAEDKPRIRQPAGFDGT